MTDAVVAPVDRLAVLHEMLLRFAGRFSDELICQARSWLAAGELVDLAQAVVFAALTHRVPMTDQDATTLAAVLTEAGEDVEVLASVERSATDPYPMHGFAPVAPEVLTEHGEDVPYSIDLTVAYDGPGGADPIDEAVVAAVRELADGEAVTAVWRAWRYPPADIRWPQPRRVYLMQAEQPARLPALGVALQGALEAAGEVDPQVEAFTEPADLPAYQRTALGFSALLWAAAPAIPVNVAAAYDRVDEQGQPAFDPFHPLLADDERERVADYLDLGVPLLITADLAEDVVDRTRGTVVPTAFRTDGAWIWTGATCYYVREHGLAPDPGLLAAIRAADYRVPDVDEVAVHRALAALFAPVDDGEPEPGSPTDQLAAGQEGRDLRDAAEPVVAGN